MIQIKIARVFPRRTEASPDDDLAFFGPPPRMYVPEVDEVHVSVTFSYDKREAEALACQWGLLGVPVKVGGRAYGDFGGEFVPGMYVKKGFVMTSRGCNNNCWFCDVPKIEGPIREIQIHDGYNILDSNLLQCSDRHINAVFDMLKRQPQRALFTGGLEARMLKPWHCERIAELNPERIYFAYDTPDDYEPLDCAVKMLKENGCRVKGDSVKVYCLIGYKSDTFEKAEARLNSVCMLGVMPYAMLYRDDRGRVDERWCKFQREWLRPQIVATKMKQAI